LSGEISLSDAIETDRDGNTLSLMDVISVTTAARGPRHAGELSEAAPQHQRLPYGPGTKIIALRYGLNNQPPKTQREIASLCGISRSYVSRIEKRALKKLEESMESKHPAKRE
jgi:RNA polymerase sporulation-specific sigma factor